MYARRLLALVGAALAVLGMAAILTSPVSNAQPLGNGYDVSCTKANDNQVVCNVAGCPRVHEDLAGDVVHIKINGGPQDELGKACGATITKTVNTSESFDFAIQGCRKSTFGSDDCGAWSNYGYVAPAPPEEKKAPKIEVPPPPQTKQCPDNGPVVAIDAACPEPEKAPTDSVSMTVSQAGFQVKVTVSNSSKLAAQCTYDATEANGLGPSVHRDFNLGANGSTTLNFPAPIIGQQYELVAACTADFKGQTVQIGRATANA